MAGAMGHTGELSPADREFFEEFCCRSQRAVWLAGRRVLEDDDLAWDAAQITLLKLARKVGLLRQMSAVEQDAYTYVAARNNALNLLRREQRFRHLPLDEVRLAGQDAPPEGELTELLAELPVKYREVLVLSVIGCLSSREVAEVLGISEAAVRKRKSRALDMLRRKMAAKGVGGDGGK